MPKNKVKPSRTLRQLVAQHKTPRRCALEWGIEPLSLERFLDGKGGINISTAAAIMEATGLDYDHLFMHH